MNQEQQDLYRFLVGLGDDAVVLSHRLSEWCSNGPYLEEDIALSNIALDYLGRARMFYQYAVEVEGQGKTEDDIAYYRDERQYTNLLIHELPINDFAFTMVRQFFVDVFYCFYLEGLKQSNDERVAAIATKALKESRYHLKRSEPWITQLSQGTEESRSRVKDALIELENFVGELFIQSDWEKNLVEAGIAVDRQAIQAKWDEYVQSFFAQSDIVVADSCLQIRGGREGIHTEHLGHMLSEMQFVQRAYPGLTW
ncbi:1,2-phenylacetyl-CoA epoxidase subunit PaaC [Aliikangiella sp. IMCC44359]|uniref:1,2-phenylacetyl-CoA epoxidase subunit PaaC n=1 Tax=Aliikangiella sp. IMCC44359 TaxID=3459125 RepID=UPI00403A919E